MTGATCYEVLEGVQALASLQRDWETLEASSADQIFQTYSYAQLWMRTIGEPSKATPLIVMLREGDRVVGIFPACRSWQHAVPILSWLGGPRGFDYYDILHASDAATSADEFVGEALRLLANRARGAFLLLPNVRDDAHAIGALRDRLRVLKQSAAPYIPVEGTYEEFVRSRGRNLRQNLVRRWQRLLDAGEPELAMLEPGDPEIVPTMERLIEFMRARHDSAAGRTNLFDERFVHYRMEQATSHPSSRVWRLQLNGVTIAASLGAFHRGRLYSIVHAFDAAYADYSPGTVLQGFGVRHCYDHGCTVYDFCWGDEAYKYRWTKCEEPLTSFVGADMAGSLLTGAVGARRRLTRTLSPKR